MRKHVYDILGFTTIFCAILISVVIQFGNPEMTQVQLFLNFWWVWLIILFMFGAGCVMLGLGFHLARRIP